MKHLQLYRVTFAHAPAIHLMAWDRTHAITTAKELCPDATFLSACLVPEWEEDSAKDPLIYEVSYNKLAQYESR
jgi:hypothetical protein